MCPCERQLFVEDRLTLNNLPFNKDFVDGKIVGELAGRNVQKYGKTMRLLRYNNHICYMSNKNAVFQSFCCPDFDSFPTEHSTCSDIKLHAMNE